MPDQYDQILSYLLKIREGTGDPWPKPTAGVPAPVSTIPPSRYAVSEPTFNLNDYLMPEAPLEPYNERTGRFSPELAKQINALAGEEWPPRAPQEAPLPPGIFEIFQLENKDFENKSAAPSIPTQTIKPPIERPKGEPIDKTSFRDQGLIEKFKASQERKREDLEKKKSHLSGLRNIAEGLGRMYPSVKADYLLTGGPPQKEPVIAEDLRVSLAELEDKLSGQRLSDALGIEGLEGLTGSEMKTAIAALSKWGTEAKQARKEQRADETLYYTLSEDFRKEEKDTFEQLAQTRQAKTGLKTNELGQKLAAIQLVKQAGESGRLSDQDIQRIDKLVGWRGKFQTVKEFITARVDETWIAKAEQLVDAYDRILRDHLAKSAGGAVSRMKSAYPWIEEDRLKNSLLSPAEQATQTASEENTARPGEVPLYKPNGDLAGFVLEEEADRVAREKGLRR